MKRYAILIILAVLTINCHCQSKKNLFNQYLEKFKTCELPITDEIINRNNLSANNPCDITKEEFDLFIKNDNNKFWIYRTYSKKHVDYFNYVAGLKFNIENNPNLIALIYFRAYLPDDVAGIISEEVLSIYSKDGTFISSVPIGGGEGDSLTFASKIYGPQKIEVNYTKYSEKGQSKFTKFYFITKDGKIFYKSTNGTFPGKPTPRAR